MMKRNLSPLSLIKDKLNTWKQKLMEMTVEDQNQPETRIQRAVYNQRLRTTLKTLLNLTLETLLNLTLETLLNLTLKTVLIGKRPENLHQAQTHLKIDMNLSVIHNVVLKRNHSAAQSVRKLFHIVDI
ncbi:hypothetical protein CgunFtcFv8_018912 [Champsocephalus gunnari]|uniref:Uncharacterized protein n=1 Tax=Champsocephalus gunnari TaxID=52237 RepID=A0AAN8DKB1_CHAGU|nr:hypothetical protein CgunFtcFv8_018912 [Champsocephalus gunnari]